MCELVYFKGTMTLPHGFPLTLDRPVVPNSYNVSPVNGRQQQSAYSS